MAWIRLGSHPITSEDGALVVFGLLAVLVGLVTAAVKHAEPEPVFRLRLVCVGLVGGQSDPFGAERRGNQWRARCVVEPRRRRLLRAAGEEASDLSGYPFRRVRVAVGRRFGS